MEQDQAVIIVLEPHALQMSCLVVPSLMRVMAELEKVSENGQLDEIDALVGCPIFFPRYSCKHNLKTNTLILTRTSHTNI